MPDLARVKELFVAVLPLSVAERAAYLDTACGGDAALRQQIEAMLRSHDQSGELLSFDSSDLLQDSGSTEADATAAFPFQASPSSTMHEPSLTDGNDLRFLTPSTKPGLLGKLGPYEVRTLLGRGGFGLVLKGFDERLHRVVAIKVLSPAYSANGAARARFLREARAAAAVKNEHVVGIHDVQENADPPYLVMEYIEGISLQDKLDKHGAINIKEILRIGMQIAEGLAAAHKQGLMHRDIKPANILLENGVERVKITDFGLARAVDDASVTQSGTVAGTPMYMSPEQAEGAAIDHRSDLFSLGTVLYAMCTGHPPFRATGTMAVLKRVIEDTPRPIREVNNEMPDWLCDIIAKLHAKKPAERFQTAREVAELLGQRLADVQAGRPIERAGSVSDGPTTHAKPVANASGSSRRRRLVYASLAFVALSAVALTITELTDRTHFFHTQRFWITILVDDPNVHVRILAPWSDEVTPKELAEWQREVTRLNEVVGSPFKGIDLDTNKVSLPAGTKWWFVCEHEGKVVYQQLVTIDGPREVRLPWAAAFAEEARKRGWTQLFNGKNLDGWMTQGDWKVNADGHLVGRGSPHAFAFTKRHDFKDFHLRTEVMISGGRGGVIFRGGDVLLKGSTRRAGYVAWLGGVPPMGSLVMPYVDKNNSVQDRVLAESPAEGGRINQWYKLEIIARGNRITMKVDGGAFEHVDQKDTLKSGAIGLENLTAEGIITFKKVEIKELPPEVSGWVQLFSGKDLKGWQANDNWKVSDGALQSVPGEGARNLRSEREDFANFHLRVEARINQGGNSGIFFRDGTVGSDFYEVQINADADPIKTGSLWHLGLDKAVKENPINPDEWFTLEVIAIDNDVTVKVNGKTTTHWIDADRKLTKGALVLQQFNLGTIVAFRKIEVKELPAEEPGWVQLFNGKNLDGWSLSNPENGSVEDGALALKSPCYASWGGRFRNFHLRTEVKVNAGGTGAIDVRHELGETASAPISTNKEYGFTGTVIWGKKGNPTQYLAGPEKELVPADTWCTLEIVARGKQVVVRVNGITTADAPIAELAKEGRIVFSARNHKPTTIHFRKIVLKELPPEEPGWVKLFNGTDLTGWDSADKQWKVENGAIVSSGKSPMSFLFTKRHDFSNFHLRGQAKLVNAPNPSQGGIAIRKPTAAFTGYKAQFSTESRVTGIWSIGTTPEVLSKDGAVSIANDTWFDFEIIADGPSLTFLVNGKQATRVTDYRFRTGGICLTQAFDSVLHFKGLEIKELPPDEPGREKLWNGKDFDGWVVPDQTVWKIEGGVIVGRTANNTKFISTVREDYENFHLRAQIQLSNLTAASRGGILIRQQLTNTGYRIPFSTITGETGIPAIRTVAPTMGWTPLSKAVGASIGQKTWFDLEIIANGPSISVKVDGKETARVTDATHRRGPIRLELMPIALAHFKNIEIKELPAEEHWVQLFNGKDLDGWVPDTPKRWQIVDADGKADDPLHKLLKGNLPVGGTPDHLKCDREFGDFHLRARAKLADSDEGHAIYFRVSSPGAWNGYGVMFSTERIAIRYTRNNNTKHSAYVKNKWIKPGEFFDLEIIARGPNLRVLINGEESASYTDPEPHLSNARGRLLVQLRPGSLFFSKIEIKELPPDEPGWVKLFNGKDVDAWSTAEKTKWTIKDSILHGTGKSWLVTKNSYTNFHLRATTRFGPDSSASIVFRVGKGTHGELGTGPTSITLGLHADRKTTNASRSKSVTKAEQWFDVDLIVRGSKATVMVNGKLAAEAALDGLPSSGPIHLSAYTPATVFEFKNIEIKELPPDAPRAKSEKELEAEMEEAKKKYQRVKDREKAGLASRIEVTDAGIEQSEAILAYWKVKSNNSPFVVEGFLNSVVMQYQIRWTIFAGNEKKGKATPAETDAAEKLLRAAEARRNEALKGWGKAALPPLRTLGALDYALEFDGKASVTIPNVRWDDPGTWTIEGYVTLPAKGKGELWQAQNRVRLVLDNDTLRLQPRVNGAFDTGINSKPDFGKRIHVATTYDNNTTRLFIDGKLRMTHDLPPAKLDKSQPGLNLTLGTGWIGTLDAIRISPIVRYTKNFTPEPRFTRDNDTYALYHCNEGEGDTLVDSGGQGRHGKITGAKWVKAGDAPTTRVPGFGQWMDPSGDCRHELKDSVLTITIPPGVHKLHPKKPSNYGGLQMNDGNQDAPRLLQEVEGDFTLEVAVRPINTKGRGRLRRRRPLALAEPGQLPQAAPPSRWRPGDRLRQGELRRRIESKRQQPARLAHRTTRQDVCPPGEQRRQGMANARRCPAEQTVHQVVAPTKAERRRRRGERHRPGRRLHVRELSPRYRLDATLRRQGPDSLEGEQGQ